MVNFINAGGEHKDCTAGLVAGGICEIPYKKVNKVDPSHTGRTVHRGGPL